MSLRHLPGGATSGDEVAEALRGDGAAVVDGLIDAAATSAIGDRLAPLLERKEHGRNRFEGTSTKRLGSLVARLPEIHPLVTHPVVLGAVGATFADTTNVQLNATQAVAISPGERRQSLHRDQWAWDHFPFPVGYEVEVSTMWAFTDFTAANGATRVALGSHRAEGKARLGESELSVAEMAAGSALFYTGSVLHGAGANTATATRGPPHLRRPPAARPGPRRGLLLRDRRGLRPQPHCGPAPGW